MKVLNRAEFLALEHQVLFAKLHKDHLDCEDLAIFCGRSGNNDFVALPIGVEIDHDDSGDLWDKIEEMRAQHATEPYCDDNTSRDGLFQDDKTQFVVFDKADTAKLVKQLTNLHNQIPEGF